MLKFSRDCLLPMAIALLRSFMLMSFGSNFLDSCLYFGWLFNPCE